MPRNFAGHVLDARLLVNLHVPNPWLVLSFQMVPGKTSPLTTFRQENISSCQWTITAVGTKSPTAQQTVRSLRNFVATHGLPYSITSDNAAQFTSKVFADYLLQAGTCHRKTTPYWPQATGEVERQNRSLLQRIRIAQTKARTGEMNC